MIPVCINGIEYSVPKLKVTNDDISKIVDTSDEWITQRTGIKSRYIASSSETASTLAIEASKKLIENRNINPETIDMIISATSSPERHYPTVACEVQAGIGAKNASAFDISVACTGYVYALQIARANVATGFAKRVLVITSDTTSKFVDWKDRTTCVLFGDGATATFVEEAEDENDDFVEVILGADGTKKEFISLDLQREICLLAENDGTNGDNHLKMAGKDVYKYVMQEIPTLIEKTLEKASMTWEDIDYFVPHQANLRMIEALTERLGIQAEKVLTNIEEFGNTSATSIPCVLSDKIKKGILKSPSTLLLCAFGAGMALGSAIVRLRK